MVRYRVVTWPLCPHLLFYSHFFLSALQDKVTLVTLCCCQKGSEFLELVSSSVTYLKLACHCFLWLWYCNIISFLILPCFITRCESKSLVLGSYQQGICFVSPSSNPVGSTGPNIIHHSSSETTAISLGCHGQPMHHLFSTLSSFSPIYFKSFSQTKWSLCVGFEVTYSSKWRCDQNGQSNPWCD